MKIAIIGYGKMGKEIEAIAKDRGHEILFKFDIDNKESFTKENLQKVDVAIEFTTPSSAYDNVMKCIEAGTPVVSGTTGWLEKLPEVKETLNKGQGALFYASNFSIGVNIFFKINEYLAKIMNTQPGYNVSIQETHHIHKKDAPSGTAITLAQGIIKHHEKYDGWVLGKNPENKKIPIEAIREDEIPGIHHIIYDSDVDTIELKHSAKSRKGFALGAVLAAEFLAGKKGFYTMDDLLKF